MLAWGEIMEDGFSFVVEYDIPAEPRLRSRFYRAIRRYLADSGKLGMWSTQSVLITDDLDLADFVFSKALEVGGKARIYVARRIRDWHELPEAYEGLERAGRVLQQVLQEVRS